MDVGELRRVVQTLDKAQSRCLAGHAVDEKVRADVRVVDAGQHAAAGGEQFGQAAQDLLVVLSQGEAAFLEGGRVDDDQIKGTVLAQLAPGLEQIVAEEADPAEVLLVQPVVVAATAEGSAGPCPG